MRSPAKRRTVRYANRRWLVIVERGAWLYLERRGVSQWVHASCVA